MDAQKTGPQIQAHDLKPGNHVTIKSKKNPSFNEGFVFQIVAVKAKTTTSKAEADDHEISLKLMKMPKGVKIKKGIASKLGIPNYINGSEATFYQVYKMMKFSSKIYYFI